MTRRQRRWARVTSWRPTWPMAWVVVLAVAGATVGVALGARTSATIGPFDTTVRARPTLSAETLVRLPPLGTISLDTHTGPLAIDIQVDELRVADAERIAADPGVLGALDDDLADDAGAALTSLARRAALVAVLGGAVGGLLARPRVRTALGGGLVGAVVALVVGGSTATTYDADALAEPRYSGLLTMAPRAVGDVESLVTRFGEYRAQLTDLVTNAVTLYQAGSSLPDLEVDGASLRVLHVSDIHLNPQAFDVIEELVGQFDIDAVADTGDITDFGSDVEEAILDGVAQVDVPYVWVRGNHDSRRIQAAMTELPNVTVLDGEAATIAGLRFWGVGDPRFTPDQENDQGVEAERQTARDFGPELARQVEAAEPPAIDVVLVHDPRTTDELDGLVPLVLAGHLHRRVDTLIGDETRILVAGSTGGAGLRGLQGEEPEPLTASILYFNPADQRLVAYDDVTIEGLGEAGVRIERTVIPRPDPDDDEQDDDEQDDEEQRDAEGDDGDT